ncbi:small acidic-like protein [Rhynchospora pubera]|uniref:Small acidic-like protein n=1 Tax=Rhynchospora pubera TaxID=906938 RepID=A0AAV8D6T8_9POAL|nr:small acidic-like protein [Rhynchospora pubera]
MSRRQGPPKHQNKFAWKPNAGRKINENELGGKFKPLSEITGVCQKCKDQIDWKRKYGKYKPITEPAKCQKCGKRAVKQAYHSICGACSKELGQCAKCCCRVNQTVGRDIAKIESEKKQLEEAITNARERERRTLLRAMNKGNGGTGPSVPKIADRSREGDIFPATSVDEYAKAARDDDDAYDDDDVSDDDIVCA